MGNNFNGKGGAGHNERWGGSPKGNFDNTPRPEQQWNDAHYKSKWISDGIDEEFPSFAEVIGKYMALNKLTSSKIRSIYGEVKRIQMGDYDKEKSSFFLLRPKVAYAYGRDKKNKGLEMFKIMFDKCFGDVKDKRTFHNFCNVMEAILAYHKAYVEKDD